ncbi:MAG: glycosyltransferase family 2 protein [Solirubrobacteraceae bacterium]
MSTPDVSIMALATRDPALIRACLDSIRATQGDLDVEVIVVLGQPSEEVRDDVARTEGVRVIDSDVNTGTAAAWNLAFDLARGPFVFGLHEDTELRPGCLQRLRETAEREPRAGALGTRVLNPDGSLQHLGAVIWGTGDLTALGEHNAPQLAAADSAFPVGVTAASAMFVRRSAWEAVGGFDERFFPFTYVDADFSIGLRAHGYDVVADPVAVTTHRRGASQAEGGGALATLRFRDWVYGRHRERLLAKWADAVTDLPTRPEGVARMAATAEMVAEALPPRVDGARDGAPRATRLLTGGEDADPPAEGPLAEGVRRRLMDAEHEVLAEFAAAQVAEREAREADVASLWSAYEETQASAGALGAELAEVRARLERVEAGEPPRRSGLRRLLRRPR